MRNDETGKELLTSEHATALFDMASVVAHEPVGDFEELAREIMILRFAAYLNAFAYASGMGAWTVSENCFSKMVH